ncbi:hypothetical protein [Euzebya sp.]|uniref:hypothetical protein n=1 Tax=Euzebya sp. TaxID=1971409 RepID=UPI0035194B4C
MKVLEPSAADLRARRERLLASIGMTYTEAQQAAERNLLSGPDFWVWREVQSIDFLLGEDED